MICPNCNIWFNTPECEGCGFGAPPPENPDGSGILDQLVEDASAPSLVTLFQRAKDKGLLKPVTSYGEGTASS